jgi:helicase
MPDFGILHAVAACPDMSSLYLRRGEFREYDLLTEQVLDEFLLPVPDNWEEPDRYEIFLAQVKTASLLNSWIDELDEKEICTGFNVGPGDVYRIRETADWLLYAFAEIARLLSVNYGGVRKLRTRLHYGVKEELLPLTKIRNIGRVRARRLYDAGFKTVKSVGEAPFSKLVQILGEGITKSVKKELNK